MASRMTPPDKITFFDRVGRRSTRPDALWRRREASAPSTGGADVVDMLDSLRRKVQQDLEALARESEDPVERLRMNRSLVALRRVSRRVDWRG
jgi:hypothetical protein